MELKKIKEIFSFEKGSLQSSKCTAGEYNFITASSEWKTHNSFDYECEALVVAVAASGSLGRVHYVNDKFISSDLCFVLKPKDLSKFPVNLEFYYSIFKSLKEDLVKSTATGTAKKSINKTNFGNYVIPYYNIEEQNRLKPVFEKVADNSEKINQELRNQKQLVSKLKQSILKEAIQGKLTADWREQNPNTEPATELLKRIKEENGQLIKEKKIKKEKYFSPISEEEFPFELPDSWAWCKLGDLVKFTDNFNIQAKLNPQEIINYVDIDSINNQNQTIRKVKQEPVINLSSRARRVLKKGYVMYSLVRPYLNNLTIIKDDRPNYIGSTGFAVFECLNVEKKYVFYFLLSSYIRDLYLGFMDGFNSPGISMTQFKDTLIPLPQFEEQKAIVEKVETLMEKCKLLEQEVKTSEDNSQMLMQAVLKEAFESKKEEVII